MRKYCITWEEETNTIIFEPYSDNKEGQFMRLSRVNVVEYVLESGEYRISSTLGGCIEYIKDKLTKEDFVTLASLFYSWGQYNGAKLN